MLLTAPTPALPFWTLSKKLLMVPPPRLKTILFVLKTLPDTPMLAPPVLCTAVPLPVKLLLKTVTTDPKETREVWLTPTPLPTTAGLWICTRTPFWALTQFGQPRNGPSLHSAVTKPTSHRC